MRGGFVACLAASNPPASRLESAAAHLRWHAGDLSLHRLGGLQIACLADDVHGPTVEIGSGRLLLGHGAAAEPLEQPLQRARFVRIESDRQHLRAIRDRTGEVPLLYRRVGDELSLTTE